jgi:hypothetical protein
MARENETPPQKKDDFDPATFAAAIAKGIVDANNATGPIKQIPPTRYINQSAYNPQRLVPSKRPKFTRTYFQNGRHLIEETQFPPDIAALEQLRPGRYLDRKVEVIERQNESGDGREIEIRYPCATPELRIEMRSLFKDFSDLLRQILAEQASMTV